MLVEVEKVILPKDVLSKTFEFLRRYGADYHEAHSIWVGKKKGSEFQVTDVWFPEQNNTSVTYEVPAEEVHRLNVKMDATGLTAIAQIHTHPGQAFHSDTDDEFAWLSLPGSFSIVIPDFGFVKKDEDTDQWAVFRYTGTGWVPLSKPKVKRIFKLK